MRSADGRITTIEQLRSRIGGEIGVGDWLEVTQERIDAFAEVTGDHQWIHVDAERCRREGRGGTVAHGYLTLALLPLLRQSLAGGGFEVPARMIVNYGSDRVRFISPVPAGGRIRLRLFLLALEPVEARVWQAKYRQTVELEGVAKPALVADTLTRMYLEPA